jgi:hypothetical protein
VQVKTHQLNALLRKSVAYQKKNWAQNCCILICPVVVLLLLSIGQALIDREIRKDTRKDDAERLVTVCPSHHSRPGRGSCSARALATDSSAPKTP